MYKYFISYEYTNDTVFGFGNCMIIRDKPITDIEDTKTISKDLESGDVGKTLPDDSRIIILNWRRFEQDE